MRVARFLLLMTLLAVTACRDDELPLAPDSNPSASVVGRGKARNNDRYIVRLRSHGEQASVAQIVRQNGGRVKRTYRRWPLMAVQLNANALAGLQRSPMVVE